MSSPGAGAEEPATREVRACSALAAAADALAPAAAAPHRVVLVEPFACSSHAQLVAWLAATLRAAEVEVVECALPGKKWHWRLRASALWAAQTIPAPRPPPATTTLLLSSMCNAAEVLGLRPDLRAPGCRSVLFMHENQLVYPVQRFGGGSVGAALGKGRDEADEAGVGAGASASAGAGAGPVEGEGEGEGRDFQLGWAQLVSLLAVDVVAWNSRFNLESFLAALPAFLRAMPDKAQRPDAVRIESAIRARSAVLYLPLAPDVALRPPLPQSQLPLLPPRRLRVAWAHRHEFDKRPELFFEVLRWLHDRGLDFEVVVLGETFREEPPVFAQARAWLEAAGCVSHWGYAASRAEYLALLGDCDVAVSTAAHEFFGIAMLEAAALGCFPLCPNGLAYPELFGGREGLAEAEGRGAERLRQLARAMPVPALAEPAPLLPLSSSQAGGGQGSGLGALGRAATSMHSSFPSPYLWSSARDLRERLENFCRRPEATVRDWRRRRQGRQGDSEAGGGAKRAREGEEEWGVEAALDLSRFTESELRPRFLALLAS